jgi:group I intron endonuclease
MKSGIYKILNKANGKFYIGSAIDIKRRWRQHRHELRLDKHKNEYFQNAWNKYLEISFEFSILELSEIDKLEICEQFWLDWFKPYDRTIGYNISATAANITGYKHTENSKILMRQAGLGKRKSEEHRINIGKGHRRIDKWPCPDGFRCKCHKCRWKRNEYVQDWQKAKKEKLNVQAQA